MKHVTFTSWAASVLAATLTLVAIPLAQAGQPCEPHTLTLQELIQGMSLAETTARALDTTGADVVVIARAGQDMRRWGLSWSHMGFAYRISPPNGDGQIGVWRVVHKLNTCGTPVSTLNRQGLGEFFMDQPWRYATAYSVLNPNLQQQLLPQLQNNRNLLAMHQPRYNMVASPWSVQYQQSNQWVLEMVAANHRDQRTREGAQAVLHSMQYVPTTLEIPAMTRLGADLTRANVAFDDQPWGERMAGRIRTITVESVFDWLRRTDLGGPIQTIELPVN